MVASRLQQIQRPPKVYKYSESEEVASRLPSLSCIFFLLRSREFGVSNAGANVARCRKAIVPRRPTTSLRGDIANLPLCELVLQPPYACVGVQFLRDASASRMHLERRKKKHGWAIKSANMEEPL